MFSTLRNRFGIPGVISVIALVFAMFGGAYAASSDNGGGKATASAKAKKGPRGPKGATGPAGPAGPQGPAGVNGKDGANGTNGTPGQSVTGTTIPVGNVECAAKEGGVKYTSASGTNAICNGPRGKEGSPWTAGGVLPPGKSETGAWTVGRSGSASSVIVGAPISFAVPVAPPTPTASTDVTYVTAAEGSAAPNCPGTVENPEAAEGNLCVYELIGFGTNFLEEINPENGASEEGAGESGALLNFNLITGSAFARGTWIVTAK